MKQASIWFGSVVLVLLTLSVIGGLGYYKYSELQRAMQSPPPPEQAISVGTDTADQVVFQQSTTMVGTILAPASIMLSNEIAGTVSSLQFTPGQVVEEGDVLVQLDTSVERAQLEAARARQTIAESVFSRIGEAARKGAVTPAEVDEATAQLAQAKAEVSELQAIIRRKTLVAPFRGKIGLSDTHKGQFLPSGTEIVTLQGLDDFVYVDFLVPQSAADSVREGQEVELMAQGRSLVGTVIAIDSLVSRSSRNLMARAKLPSNPDFLVPGDSAKVSLKYGPETTTAAVPVEALLSAPMQTFVYVVTPDKAGALRAYERIVVPGPTIGNRLSILAGLEVGETVVDVGSFKLRDREPGTSSGGLKDGVLVNPIPNAPAESQPNPTR